MRSSANTTDFHISEMCSSDNTTDFHISEMCSSDNTTDFHVSELCSSANTIDFHISENAQFCQYYKLSYIRKCAVLPILQTFSYQKMCSFANTTDFHVSELCSSAITTNYHIYELCSPANATDFHISEIAVLPALQIFMYHQCETLPTLQTSKCSSIHHTHIYYCSIEHVIVSGLYQAAVARSEAAGVSSWLLRTSAVHGGLLTHSVRTSTACQWQWRIYCYVTSSLFPFTSFPNTNSASHYQLCRSFETCFLPLLLDPSTCM
jgi:hypothetical protein